MVQVGNVADIWVRGIGLRGHDGMDDYKGGGFFLLDRRISDPVIFELPGEVTV